MASRVFPGLYNNSQSSSVASSVTNKPSSTTDNSTTITCTSEKSNLTAIGDVVKKKSSSNKNLPTPSFTSVDQLNDLLDKHILESQAPDVHEIDNEDEESDEYVEIPVSAPSLPLTPSTKRAFKGTTSKVSVSSKRSKTNINNKEVLVDSENDNHKLSSSFQKNVMEKLKRGEVDGQYNRQMFEQLLAQHQRHEATQKAILENQKKIKKALLKSKIYVDIQDDVSQTQDSSLDENENSFPSELPYSTDDGKTINNALLIPGDRSKKNLYALKLVDKLFTRDELIELDPLTKKNALVEHQSYLFIKEAVRCKFKLTSEKMTIEWPNIHDAILNKRRNWKKDINVPASGGVPQE
ncbi:unnamed protein product [Adineta steineri]|uniref:Uncharacterized protein n=1 Tax=Adineta steineri TaxID=433720 RepID=A0A819PV72_9BILA|nr:unnamed protein product [Adineta steineri]CAF1416425.1 unnamed protein product [Adineta steineri]CAF4014984.1 unnamed protein product [Adineta steineri]CAF4052332.1 unnamed protein product [Adineta steineri]